MTKKQPQCLTSLIEYLNEEIDEIGTEVELFLPIVPSLATNLYISTSDFLILSTILYFNLKGEFCSKKNQYFTLLLGIEKSQVEKSLSSLLQYQNIDYVDENGIRTYGTKPIKRNLKKTETSEKGKIYFNSKREFVVTVDCIGDSEVHYPGFKALYSNDPEFLKEQRAYNRSMNKRKSDINKVAYFLKKKEFSKEFLFEMNNEDFRNKNHSDWKYIEALLDSHELNYNDIMKYLNNRRIKKKYYK